jgi:hypothetical protein
MVCYRCSVAPYKSQLRELRQEKALILAKERDKLKREYEYQLHMERAALHEKLARELAFRSRNEMTNFSKNQNYGGLLNPPKLGGEQQPRSEAMVKARQEFKIVADDSGQSALSDTPRALLMSALMMVLTRVHSVPGYVVTRVLGAVSGCAYIEGQ